MNQSIYVPVRVIKSLLAELSSTHGDVEVDIEIIQSIVNGWKQGRAQDHLRLSEALREMATTLEGPKS